MTTFPITYIEVIVWLILITYQDTDYWMRFEAKFTGCFFGMWLAINTFNGEQWLFVSTSGLYTQTQVKDGFQLPLSLIVLALSLILLINIGISLAHKDWQKQNPNENPNESGQ